MLKWIGFLNQNRSLVAVVLCSPVIAVLLSSHFQFSMVPESPFTIFNIEFRVPMRSADEIAREVITPAEKVFNGLAGLLAMESTISPGLGKIQIRFDEKIKAEKAYLFIQEKMDQVKLHLPGSVESTQILQKKLERPPDLTVTLSEKLSPIQFKKLLAPVWAKVANTDPPVKDARSFQIFPNPKKLAQNGTSISQLVQALQTLGLTTSIGRKDGVLVETGSGFRTVEDITGTVVSKREHRLVRVIDVAEVRLNFTQETDRFSIWLDTTRVSLFAVLRLLREADADAAFGFPNFKAFFNQSIHPVLGFVTLFLLQLVFFRRTFGRHFSLVPIIMFFSLLGIHFLFWKGLISGDLTVLDLHALVLTQIFGFIFLVMIFSRIQNYQTSDYEIKKLPRKQEQIVLFTLSELVPTFLVVCVIYWVFSMPLLHSSLNLPSRTILDTFFFVGLPILFFFLGLVPILINFDWTKKIEKHTPPKIDLPRTKKREATFGFFIIALAIGASFVFSKLSFGVLPQSQDGSFASKLMNEFRSYHSQLEYVSADNSAHTEMQPVKKNANLPHLVWNFSNHGRRYLKDLDLQAFADALEKIQNNDTFGFLGEGDKKIPLKFNAQIMDQSSPGNLLIASKNGSSGMAVRLLTNREWQTRPYQIIRDQMKTHDRFSPQLQQSKGNLRWPVPKKFEPTTWSAFVLKELATFFSSHWVSLTFGFLILSLYLNSFVRAGVFIFFVLALMLPPLLGTWAFPQPYHVDSLWMLHLIPIFFSLYLLALIRLVDIERSRGNDRDISVKEVLGEIVPHLRTTGWFVVLGFCCMAILEKMPWFPSLGVWYEGVFVGLFLTFIPMAILKIVFPLFYLQGEELIDHALFRVYRWVLLKKNR